MKNRSLFLAVLAILNIFVSCKKDSTDDAKIAIGESYQGGIIFYVDATGKHDLIVAPSDEIGVWQNCTGYDCGTLISGANGDALGTGQQNTTDIIHGYGADNHMAAYICDQLVIGKYSDWFLPSREELFLVGVNLALPNLATFPAGTYWSSTQSTAGSAFIVGGLDGALSYTTAHKELSNGVRAVRAF